MEENKIMLKELIDEYCAKKSELEKNSVIKKMVKVEKYVDYAMKVAVSRAVIKQVCLDEDTMEFKLNSPERYIAFVIASIDLYTNIDTGDEDDYTTYDLMQRDGFAKVLAKHISNSTEDYAEFSLIWNMCFEDIKAYYSSIEVLLRKAATRIGLVSEVGLNRLANAIEGFDMEKYSENLENSSLVKTLEKLVSK